MAETTYRSPGFFETEIDLSAPTQEQVTATPAGVVGPSPIGPAFVPTTITSLAQYKERFVGNSTERNNSYFSAQEFFRNGRALTFVRTLGAGANATLGDASTTKTQGTVKGAGFVIKGSAVTVPTDSRTQGAVQFLVAKHDVATDVANSFPTFIDNNSFSTTPAGGGTANIVRGVILTATGSRVQILSHNQNYSPANAADDAASIQGTTAADNYNTFKIVISSSAGNFGSADGYSSVKVFTASLDPANPAYISNILNTAPDLFQEKQHLLYLDFAVENNLAAVSSATDSVAILSGSLNTSANSGDTSLNFKDAFGRFDSRYKTARTTKFISQPFGGKEYGLFNFETLSDGASVNTDYKISIANLRRSTDPRNPYGTFTVLVRSFNDTDGSPQIFEQYTNCTLNPDDSNYVGRLIGDRKVTYNFDATNPLDRNFVTTGQFANVSTRVRIVMDAAVASKEVPAESLPFGFGGIPTIKLTSGLTDTDLPGYSNRLSGVLAGAAASLTSSITPPVPMRFKVTDGATAAASSAPFTGSAGASEFANGNYYWGIKQDLFPTTAQVSTAVLQSNYGTTLNPLITTLTRFSGIELLDVVTTGSSADNINNNKFSLSKVALFNAKAGRTALQAAFTDLTGTLEQHMVNAVYIRNASPSATDNTISDRSISGRLTFGSLALIPSASIFNRFSPYMKFTNVFYGGFDGLNILDSDMAAMNDKSTSAESGGKAIASPNIGLNISANNFAAGTSNALVSAYRTATKIITDAGSSRANIITVPGIRDPLVTDYASSRARGYARGIYLMDIPTYTDTGVRIFDTTLPDVTYTVRQFGARNINNNYVATYFPDASIFDESVTTTSGKRVRVPASVVALGALAQNDARTYPWYAPAGFNRTALSNVTNLAVRLSSADRDTLYESRINPITSFPGLGFVIFGQKTLQIARSALDRVNVRRLMIELARQVTAIGLQYVFEPNTPQTRTRFVNQLIPQLATVQSQSGIDSFRVIMDESNNTQRDIEANVLNGTIIVVPTKAVEFIAIDFIITNAGVEFV